jgi:streptogramin lyase
MKRFFGWNMIGALVLAVTLLLGAATVTRAQGEPYLTEYPVPGSPQNLAVEAPGRIWYTLPASGEIGLLLPSGDSSTTEVFAAGGEPYDLVVANGSVWFTDRTGNRIGEFDIGAESFTYYPVPTAASVPTAIAAMPNGLIWFTERAAGKLAVLDPATDAITEYPYNSGNAELGDVAIRSNRSVWMTVEDRNEIVEFALASETFQVEQTSIPGARPVARPLGVTIDRENRPWMTILGRNGSDSLIARYVPATTFRVRTTPTATPDSGPAQIAFYDAGDRWYLFYSESTVGKVARLTALTSGAIGGTVEAALGGGSAPWGVDVDENGQAWFAISGNNSIAGWQPPHIDETKILLPIVVR